MKSKPAVKYDSYKVELCGETHQIKQKLTRIAVLNGEEAKSVNTTRTKGDGFITRYSGGTKGKGRLGFFEAETVEDKIIEEDKKDE
jgi:hypothetical protein